MADEARETIRKELDNLRNTVVVLSGQAAMLTKQSAEAKREARRYNVASALGFVKSAAGRRLV